MNPSRLRGTVPARPGRAGEPVDAPPRLHAAPGVPGDVAQRVQDGVRVTRAELDYQVAAALRRVKVVVGERAHRRELGGQLRGQPVALVEERGSDADRHGQAVRHHGRPEHAGVGRRRPDADRRRGAARGQEPGPCGDRLEKLDEFRRGRPRSRRTRSPRSGAAARAGCRPGTGRGTAPAAARPPRRFPAPTGWRARAVRRDRRNRRPRPRRRRSRPRPGRRAGTPGGAAALGRTRAFRAAPVQAAAAAAGMGVPGTRPSGHSAVR